MKKLLKTVACLSLGLFTLTTVSAKEVDLTEGTVLEKNNIYIVGNWVFQLNKYGINGFDISDAASKYTLLTGKRNVKVYYIVAGEVYEYNQKGNSDPKLLGTVAEVFKGSKINATGLNDTEYEDLVLEKIEPALEADAETLNASASDNGFESIKYENNTLTFDIADPTKKLEDYAESGIIKMFTDIVSGAYGFQEISFTLNGETVTKKADELTNEAFIKVLAGQVLLSMVEDPTGLKADDLTYALVANRSTTATATYKDENGNTYSVTYTLKFTYNVNEEKNKDLNTAATELNKNAKNYGFKSITYNAATRTATFDITDSKKTLFEFASSGILNMWNKYSTGATYVKYTIDGVPTEVDLTAEGTDPKVLAAKMLFQLAGLEGEYSIEAAQKLTLADVAGKSATAVFTFEFGGEITTLDYTLVFDYDLNEDKDETLTDYVSSIKGKDTSNWFKDIKYAGHTATFTIATDKKNQKFTDFPGKTDIVEMFNAFVVDATAISYTVGTETVPVELSNVSATTLAGQVLAAMAKSVGKEVTTLPDFENLKLEDVIGSTATATVTYKVGDVTDTITYTLNFVAEANE